MRRASEKPPLVPELEGFELQWRNGDSGSQSKNSTFEKVLKWVAYPLLAVLLLGFLSHVIRKSGPYTAPVVTLEPLNVTPFERLQENRIGYSTVGQSEGLTILVQPKDADRAVELLVADSKKRGYWLVVRHGPKASMSYNRIDPSAYSINPGTPVRPRIPLW